MATKKITDLVARTDFDATCTLPADDATQTWKVTGAQMFTYFGGLLNKITTRGDVQIGGVAGALGRLAIGAMGTTLRSDGTDPAWGFRGYQAKTGTYTAVMSDEVLVGSTAGGAFTITLPTAVGCAGKFFRIVKGDTSANLLGVATTSAQTLGLSGPTSVKLHRINEYLDFISDGANWLMTPTFRTVSAVVALSGSSSITSQTGSWLTSIGNLSSGNSAGVIVSGIFSAAPQLLVGGSAADDNFIIKSIDTPTTTAFNIRAYSSSAGTDGSSGIVGFLTAIGPY